MSLMEFPEAMGWLKVHAPHEVQRAIANEHLARVNADLQVESLRASNTRWAEEKNKAWRAAMQWRASATPQEDTK